MAEFLIDGNNINKDKDAKIINIYEEKERLFLVYFNLRNEKESEE